jgi:hypothetical protein
MTLATKVVNFTVKLLGLLAVLIGCTSVGFALTTLFPESYPLGLVVNFLLGFFVVYPTYSFLFGADS